MDHGRGRIAQLPLVRGIASLVESLTLGGEALRFSGELMERDFAVADDAAPPARATQGRAEDLAEHAIDDRDRRERGSSGKAGRGVGSTVLRALYTFSLAVWAWASLDPEASDEAASGSSSDARRSESPPAASAADDLAQPGLSAHSSRGQFEGAAAREVRASSNASAKESAPKWPMTVMLVAMVAFTIALPQAAAAGLCRGLGLHLDVQSPGFQALTGVFKLVIVIGYLAIIRSLLPDIRRVFQYHGAEHKTISTYEAGEDLTVEHARKKTTLHPRCGTTFLVMVALVSIVVFTAVGGLLPKIATGNAALDNLIFFFEKLPFLPLIAAVTFEVQRVFAKYCTTGPLRILLWPGFLVQKITTIEPDDAQLEVALASLRVTLFREQGIEKSERTPPDVRYANFSALMTTSQLRRAS